MEVSAVKSKTIPMQKKASGSKLKPVPEHVSKLCNIFLKDNGFLYAHCQFDIWQLASVLADN